MREFDLEEAKAGKPVCTRDGRAAIIEMISDAPGLVYPIIGWVIIDGREICRSWLIDGNYYSVAGNKNDLFMADEEIVSDTPKELNKGMKAFDRVLVRDEDDKLWFTDIYTAYFDWSAPFVHKCIGNTWVQCIPYEGNEHLLGTTGSPTGSQKSINPITEETEGKLCDALTKLIRSHKNNI